MIPIFRATTAFLRSVRHDLARSHRFAGERIGFISIRATTAGHGLLLLAERYYPVADEDYVDDPSVGAMMGQEAIRKALDVALLRPVGMFHVHMHWHDGTPGFSEIDLHEQPKFVPDFFKVRRHMPHGALVLSHDRAAGRVWLSPETSTDIKEFNSVGRPRMIIDVVRAALRRGRTK